MELSGEKLMAMESMITAYALNQMQSNDVSPELACLIMKCVLNQFQENYINSSLLNRIKTISVESESHTDEKPEESKT